MKNRVGIEELADAVMEGLQEYADLTTADMKTAVRHAGKTVQDEIRANAPKDSGAYAKSWRAKETRETSNSLVVTVFSRNHYRLAHLLEHGHVKRGGGRVQGKPHIAPAEERGITQLQAEIERSLRDG